MAVVDGDFALAAGRIAVTQGIKCRARMIRGECFLDETVGVDWQRQILSIKNPNSVIVSELIREAIAETTDVTSAQGTSYTPPGADRTATVGFQTRDIYSTEPQSGTVEAP